MKHNINEEQRHAGRMREEGKMAKNMRADGGIPVTGPAGHRIHGKTTGHMASATTGMVTDSGNDTHIGGKPGDRSTEA